MRCYLLAVLNLALFTGCSPLNSDTAPAVVNPSAGETVAAAEMTGKEAFEAVCVRCHGDGSNGAPRIGDRAAWVNRSQLWEAVLFEHAKGGYLGMPARGGEVSFDDATVAKAAEYMLQQTYPDRLRAD